MLESLAYTVLVIGLPLLAVVCFIVGLVKRASPPQWLVAAATAPPVAAVGVAIWTIQQYGADSVTLSVILYSTAAVALLILGTVIASRANRLGRGLLVTGLLMPVLPAVAVLLFYLALATSGGME